MKSYVWDEMTHPLYITAHWCTLKKKTRWSQMTLRPFWMEEDNLEDMSGCSFKKKTGFLSVSTKHIYVMRSNKQISALILALCAVLKELTSINYISINTCRIFSEGQTIVELKVKHGNLHVWSHVLNLLAAICSLHDTNISKVWADRLIDSIYYN